MENITCNLSEAKVTYDKLFGGTPYEIISEAMRDYLQTHPYNVGDPDCENILDLLYRAYAETHESDPPEIQAGFIELEEFLKTLPLDDNNAVFNLTCRLCTAYEQKSFLDGLQFGAELMLKLTEE